MSAPVTLWRNSTCGWIPSRVEDSDEAYRAMPAEEFERMAADARGLRWLIDASKHPGNAALRKAMEDLGVSEPAGPPVKVIFFQSGWAHPAPPPPPPKPPPPPTGKEPRW